MDNAPDDDDPRSVELETLTAIYPEIRPVDAPPFTFELDLPVQPTGPVTVLFATSQKGPEDVADDGARPQEPVDSLLVTHLPSLCLRLTLPDGYPDSCPPLASLSTTPKWLPLQTLTALELEGPRLWEEAGRDLVAYTYIDHVQRAAEDVFGAVSTQGTLEVNAAHKLAVLDYDVKAKRAAFERETWECGVCLDPKRGSACHRMLECAHVFCLRCLGDFYRDAIEQGNLSSVRCLAPNCAKERASAASSRRKPKMLVSPGELLQMGLGEDAVKRYVALRYKTELESDKDTVYCPRRWCNGAARSKRHRKPEGLEFGEAAEVESDADEVTGKAKFIKPADLLCVCEDCGFAFCSRCLQTWHGEFVRCTPKRNKDDLTEEDKASLEYMQLHTSPCPTCNAPAQKTHGCNHMICSRCETHFCYLCSSWLDPANPYKHYNQQSDGKVTSCYMRLWELEGGDGDDVGLGYEGGRGVELEPVPDIDGLGDDDDEEEEEEEEEEDDDDDDSDDDDDDDEPGSDDEAVANQNDRGQPVAVAREAPLVLRLMDNQPRAAARRGEDADPGQPAAPPRGGRRGRGRARGAAAAVRGRGQNLPARRGAGGGRAGRGRGRRGGGQEAGQLVQDANRLDAAHEEWVRRFVAMALMDAEDEVEEGDSDTEDNFMFLR